MVLVSALPLTGVCDKDQGSHNLHFFSAKLWRGGVADKIMVCAGFYVVS